MVRNPPGLSGLNARLTGLQRAERLRYLGTDRPDGLHAVEVHGQQREFPAREMIDWLNGFTAGLQGEPQPPGDRAAIATVRNILVNPPLFDQVRIRVFQAIEDRNLKVHEFVDRVGLTRKAAAEALKFGAPGALSMLAMLGVDPGVRADLAERDPDLPLEALPPDDRWREPDVITRLRALGYAHERGVVTWVSPTEVNKAFYARTFGVLIGTRETHVHTTAVRNYLVGVADAVMPDAGDALYTAVLASIAAGGPK